MLSRPSLVPAILAGLSIAALATAQPAMAPGTPPPSGAADIVINMHDVEIAAVADQISRLTGRTLILDPQVRGTVNVTSAEPLSPSGAWELFQSVLRVHGFATVRSGRAWRIVPQADAVRGTGTRLTGSQVVTRLIRLRNVTPDTAARILRPLVAQFGSLEALTNPNGIVVTDYADNVARIERLAATLDGGRGPAAEAISLRTANARDVGQAVRSLFGEGDAGPKVAVDERSNTVIIRGDARAVAEARRLIASLDRPGGATPTLRVFRLRNNDAESVTQVLSGLLGGTATTPANNPVARTLAGGEGSFGAGQGGGGQGGLSMGSASAQSAASGGLGGVTGGSGGGGSNMSSMSSVGSLGNVTAGSPSQQGSGFSTPDLAVQSAPELNAIVVRGTPAGMAQIAPLIEQLDVRRPQVMIEAAIVEITGDKAEALGVQFGLGKDMPNINRGVTSFSNIGASLTDILTALGVPGAGALSATGLTGAVGVGDKFQLLVQALGSSSKANLLSTPSITTLDNQAAQIVVGQNVPFRTGAYQSLAGGTTTPFTTIERQDVGLTLRLIPRIHDGDVIRLDVSQEVSSLVDAVSGAADLVTNRRVIQTTVLADDGQTIVLGGLIQDDRLDSKSQVPVLGDLPVVGNLFKSRQMSRTRRTLFVFLRPTILRSADQVAAAAEGKYARVRGAESALDDNSSLLLSPPKARLLPEISGIY